AIKPVVGVQRLVREIELRGEELRVAPLQLHVDVRRTVEAEVTVVLRLDGLEFERACSVGELVSAEAEAVVVVDSGAVAAPHIDDRTGKRPAVVGEDTPA